MLKENKALEEKKSTLVMSTAEKKEKIAKLEDEILWELNNATVQLIDNISLQQSLERSKITSEEVTKELESFAQMEKKIDTLRNNYRSIADRASLLFFIM